MAAKKVLVAGGAGYIGSTMVRMLAENGYEPVVFDNLSAGHREFVPRGVLFVKGDLRGGGRIDRVLESFKFDCVMHFAASALVPESVADPLKYYDNNVGAFIHLLKAMKRSGTKKLIFSSTCAVYGEPDRVPMREADKKAPTNPYGWSKLMIERILQGVSGVGDVSYAALRYFNAAGAHAGGETGEAHDPETHIIPNIFRAMSGRGAKLTVHGGDYPTRDGTCVRDYVHIDDLCRAHLLAYKALSGQAKNEAFNLGNGKGFSVMEVIRAAERITGKKVPYTLGRRRPGDAAELVADAGKARRVLGWRALKGLDEIIRSAWEWEAKKKAVLAK